MRSLMQLAEEASSTPLSEQDIDWLHLLFADWQVLADLAAADLVLWLPADDGRFIAANHCRPRPRRPFTSTTSSGCTCPPPARSTCIAPSRPARLCARRCTLGGTYSMQETCVPVCHDGRIIAVITRETNLSSPRLSMGFEGWTIAAADTLCQMIARGEYPLRLHPRRSPPTAFRASLMVRSCSMRRARPAG